MFSGLIRFFLAVHLCLAAAFAVDYHVSIRGDEWIAGTRAPPLGEDAEP